MYSDKIIEHFMTPQNCGSMIDAAGGIIKAGLIGIFDWEKKETEMGPSINERISKEEMIQICSDANFTLVEDTNINADHYGLKFRLL